MGHWSIYCGISQIAISSGNACVLLPLKKTTDYMDNRPYTPATLPIFGNYNDYGCLENIEENPNTKLIEEHFGITIQEFADIFPEYLSYKRDEGNEIVKKMKNFDEIKEWKYMWIDRKVWDFMSTYLDREIKGHLEFGNEGILKLIGFKYIGENTKNKTFDPKRFKYEWEFEGKKFYSDGQWIEDSNGKAIYAYDCWHSKEASLTAKINVPEDKKWIGEKAMCQMWKYVSKSKAREQLGWIIGKKHWDGGIDMDILANLEETLLEKLRKASPELYEEAMKLKAKNPNKTLAEKYMADLQKFGDGLAELVVVRHNLYPMSGYFAPYILYLTPQDGEPQKHQHLLKKFAEINKQNMLDRGYENDEE
jgi:hypothetical protein